MHVEPCIGTETALFETKFAILLVFFVFMFLRKNRLKLLLDFDFFGIIMSIVSFTNLFFVIMISLRIYSIKDVLFMFYSCSCDVQGMI